VLALCLELLYRVPREDTNLVRERDPCLLLSALLHVIQFLIMIPLIRTRAITFQYLLAVAPSRSPNLAAGRPSAFCSPFRVTRRQNFKIDALTAMEIPKIQMR
jgi:hypothetical protein